MRKYTMTRYQTLRSFRLSVQEPLFSVTGIACLSSANFWSRYCRSSDETHLAVSGESSMVNRQTTAQISGGMPSRMKRVRQSVQVSIQPEMGEVMMEATGRQNIH